VVQGARHSFPECGVNGPHLSAGESFLGSSGSGGIRSVLVECPGGNVKFCNVLLGGIRSFACLGSYVFLGAPEEPRLPGLSRINRSEKCDPGPR